MPSMRASFGARQDAVGEDHEPGAHGVAAIREDGPASTSLVPLGLLDGRVEEAVFVETELHGHGLAVLEDLEARRELHRREVLHLFEKGQVAVGLDVAGDARVAVPVPGAADVPALLAEAHVAEPRRPELVPQEESGEARPDHDDFALVVERVPGNRGLRIHVFEVAAELALHRHVVGCAAPGLLERAVLRLLFGIEHRARGLGRELLQGFVRLDGVALARDLLARLGGARIEDFETGFGVDLDRGHGALSAGGWVRERGTDRGRRPPVAGGSAPSSPTLPFAGMATGRGHGASRGMARPAAGRDL